MASVGKQILNATEIHEVDANPSTSGVAASLGSIAMQTSGAGLFYKIGSNDVDWWKTAYNTGYSEFEDFNFTSFGSGTNRYSVVLLTSNGGAGSIDTTVSANNYSGAVILAGGTNIFGAGVATIDFFNSINRFSQGVFHFVCEFRLKMPNLSTSGVPYQIGAGLGNDPSATQGSYFYYTHSNLGGRWQCTAVRDGTSTNIDSGVTVIGDAWYTMRMEIEPSTPSVTFYINNVQVGYTTNNVASAGTRPIFTMQKLAAGATSRNLIIDYVYWKLNR